MVDPTSPGTQRRCVDDDLPETWPASNVSAALAARAAIDGNERRCTFVRTKVKDV